MIHIDVVNQFGVVIGQVEVKINATKREIIRVVNAAKF